MKMFEAITKSSATGVAALVWLAAAVAVIGAAYQASMSSTERMQLALVDAAMPPSIAVTEQKLTTQDYDKIAAQLSPLHPDITIQSDSKGLRLSTRKISAYHNWLLALFDVMAADPEARWDVLTMCAGSKCGGEPYNAQLIAVKKKAVPTR